MDWSELPSLTSLRAFAALAERKSYTRAATVLNVSHAAVSQQVKALEERLQQASKYSAGLRDRIKALEAQLATANEPVEAAQ